ncbi:hypothetical protein J1N51_00320 [Psychrosphaera ytuae]|uniref:Uncharacterized protein n=1 Tax=Psychrosphaera ytuae TaxID=2820710 RepID=A0A975DBN6_9GAMM|nr:hypothetical protein J1N51_00320 [Psychrosphaera ytuae]
MDLKTELNLKKKVATKVREKAIKRAETRIMLAGKTPTDFNEAQLEVLVKEEEDKIFNSYKEKGLLVLASLLGLSLWS